VRPGGASGDGQRGAPRRDASLRSPRARREIESRRADARRRATAAQQASERARNEANAARDQANGAQSGTGASAAVAELAISDRVGRDGTDRRHLRGRQRAATGQGGG